MDGAVKRLLKAFFSYSYSSYGNQGSQNYGQGQVRWKKYCLSKQMLLE